MSFNDCVALSRTCGRHNSISLQIHFICHKDDCSLVFAVLIREVLENIAGSHEAVGVVHGVDDDQSHGLIGCQRVLDL